MSKCEISICFDRQDRTYAGGEPITGRVIIHVNEDAKCRGISLIHQWKTHGRGNVSLGPKETINLDTAESLVAGEILEFPFSVASATHPLTYHGTLINIDHYLSAEVEIPWAINPKAQEEFILVAGEPPSQFVGSRKAVISLAPQPQKSGPIATVLIGVLLLALLIPLAMFAIFLLPFALIAITIVWIIGRVLANRLGEVQLEIPYAIIAPGENWPLRIRFQPRKQFRINGIFVTLKGNESAKSGSGTQSTTHTHQVFEHKAVIRPAQTLEADVPVDENFSFTFPGTTAYSFEATDNKIQWTAEVRIDIPSFPDWKKSQPLQVVPREFLKKMSDAPPAIDDVETFMSPDTQSVVKPAEVNPIDRPSAVANQPAYSVESGGNDASESSTSPPQDLLELAARLGAASRHGNDRANIIQSVLGEVFDATIIVDRVNSSIGVTVSDPGFDGGKTVTGTIQGTDQAIQVITLKLWNDEVTDLRRRDAWQVQITIDRWDSLYNRIDAHQQSEAD